MKNITLDNYMELRKNLIDNQEHLDLFNKYQPYRTIESSFEELNALRKYYNERPIDSDSDFDKVIIAQDDKIIPSKNQILAWYGHKNTRIVSGGHFIFYNMKLFLLSAHCDCFF